MQPPQNPYSGQPQPSPGRSGTVSTDAISEAWAALKPNLGTWIGVALIYFIVIAIFGGIQNALTPKNAQGHAQFSALALVFNLISTTVSIFLGAGLFKVAIQQLRTGRAEIGELFNIFDVAVALIVAAILTAIVTTIGFVLCIIPGIIAALGLSMTNPLIVDQNVDGIGAMQRSWETMKAHLGSYFIVGLVLGLINLLGACACGLGLLVTVPLTYLTTAIIYRDLFLGGSMVATPATPNFPPPPIADPRG